MSDPVKGQTIHVLSMPLVIVEQNPGAWEASAQGRSNSHSGLILLNSTMSPHIKVTTLLHEVLHFVDNHLDLDIGEEHQISGLAAAILSLIKDNPTLVQSILDLNKPEVELGSSLGPIV